MEAYHHRHRRPCGPRQDLSDLALTGVDTDRLKEEQKGASPLRDWLFAQLTLPKRPDRQYHRRARTREVSSATCWWAAGHGCGPDGHCGRRGLYAPDPRAPGHPSPCWGCRTASSWSPRPTWWDEGVAGGHRGGGPETVQGTFLQGRPYPGGVPPTPARALRS